VEEQRGIFLRPGWGVQRASEPAAEIPSAAEGSERPKNRGREPGAPGTRASLLEPQTGMAPEVRSHQNPAVLALCQLQYW